MHQIIIYGNASHKTILKVQPHQSDLDLTLLEWLQKYKVPMASSCQGEGMCRKCVVNDQLLSCQVTVKSILNEGKKVSVDYL